MSTIMLLKKYMAPRLGAIKMDEAWYSNSTEEGRLFVSFNKKFFIPSSTSIRGCIREAISDLFYVSVDRIRNGITIIGTNKQSDLANILPYGCVIRRGSIYQIIDLIHMSLWVLKQPYTVQRRLRYDNTLRCCVTEKRLGDCDGLFQSPKLRKYTYWNHISSR